MLTALFRIRGGGVSPNSLIISRDFDFVSFNMDKGSREGVAVSEVAVVLPFFMVRFSLLSLEVEFTFGVVVAVASVASPVSEGVDVFSSEGVGEGT